MSVTALLRTGGALAVLLALTRERHVRIRLAVSLPIDKKVPRSGAGYCPLRAAVLRAILPPARAGVSRAVHGEALAPQGEMA
jgi:hypothetical protein